MTDLAYDTIIERTHKLLKDFDEKYQIYDAIKNQEIQIIGTSGTVTVLGAVHLNLPRYNRSAVDGISITRQDIDRAIAKIKRLGDEGRRRHPCIGAQKADLTMAGCAIIEALCSFWPIEEITVADRGIREGILLDMMHSNKAGNFHRKKRFRHRIVVTTNRKAAGTKKDRQASEPEKDRTENMKKNVFAAIDLGTNSCRLVIADERGRYLYKDNETTKPRGRNVCADAFYARSHCAGNGLSVPVCRKDARIRCNRIPGSGHGGLSDGLKRKIFCGSGERKIRN